MRSLQSPLILVLIFFLSLLKYPISIAADDTISIGQSLSGDQTIVSKGGIFELGFFTPGNSRNHYIGIWYKKISVQTVVWVANRVRPVKNSSSSELRLSEDGNLVLLDHSKSLVWSTNSTVTATGSTVAVLLDSGNLVVQDNSNASVVLWQSFDHPTNTWLQGAKFGMNKITRETTLITSWKSDEDPAPGTFSVGLDPNGTIQFKFWWNGTQEYFTSGLWNGQYFSALPEMIPATAYTFTFVTNERENYFIYRTRCRLWCTGLTLDVAGQMHQSAWLNTTNRWMLYWSQPKDQCTVYSVCGAFGLCDQTALPFCTCLPGFKEVSAKERSLGDFSSGCIRKTPLQCGNVSSVDRAKDDGFLPMAAPQLPPNSQSLKAGSADECEAACLNSCSCTAYSYSDGCLVWHGELLNLRRSSNQATDSASMFVRLARIDLPSAEKKKVVTGILVAIVAGSVFIICIILLLAWYFFRRKGKNGMRKVTNVGSLVLFSYSHLQQVTKNFSESLGRGGFGSVFKGVLHNMTLVAVKKLEGVTQGEKQFRAEVSTLGSIQHVNLVHLRGFCSEGTNRLLVYDYMPNGSLDSLLFGKTSIILDWNIRYQVALGVARGLAYLHEKCRDCIIHCDVKPENVLLDSNFCAKLADFGLAKLIGRDFSRVLTTARGTIGYLAPEWISGLPITPKADVYSFGMMLLEIISGRRNRNHCEDGELSFFPLLAANKVNEGEVLILLDDKLEGNCDVEELSRACKVACWCIQGNEGDRPSMGQVVQMLEGALEVDTPPVPTYLLNLLGPLDDCDPLSKFLLNETTSSSEISDDKHAEV